MFVFIVKNLVFGACDEDHLKEGEYRKFRQDMENK